MYARVVGKGCLAVAIAAMAGLAIGTAPSSAQDVRIGELNSYSRMAAFAVPYRNGMQLAQDEINAKGGVMGGRKIEIVFRDDGAHAGRRGARGRGAADARERRRSWPARSCPTSAWRSPTSPTRRRCCSWPPSR